MFAIRYQNWKRHFQVKDDWFYAGEKLWTIMPAAHILMLHAETFTNFPLRQAPPDFNPSKMLKHAMSAAANDV